MLLLIAGLQWGAAPAANAADTTPQTSFAIDGDIAGPNDWQAPYGPGVTPGGLPTTGLLDLKMASEPCLSAGPPADTTKYAGGQSVQSNPWTPSTGNVNEKSDLCSVGGAYEIVETSPGVYDYIFYSYWSRSAGGTGDLSVFTHLEGPNPGRGDDILIQFDYNSNQGGGVTVSRLAWTGSAWSSTTVGGVHYDAAVGRNVSSATGGTASGNVGTFGELAINLTSSGILPTDRCSSFTSGVTLSQTGNSLSAQLQDSAQTDPITINTCGSISVTKEVQPAGTTGTFGYTVDQADGGTVHDTTLAGDDGEAEPNGSTATITGTLTVPGDPTDTWGNVIASPDYRITETSMSEGFAQSTVRCTYSDPFTGGQTTNVTLYENGAATGATVPVLPSDIAGDGTHCVITNQTSGLVIEKEGAGDETADFTFSVTDKDAQVLGLGDSSPVLTYAPGTAVTITEALPTGGLPWVSLGVVCRTGDGTTVASSDTGTVQVTTVANDTVTCTYTNEQQGKIKIIKDVRPDNGEVEFDFTGAITATLGDGESAEAVVVPNVDSQRTPAVTAPYAVVEAAAGDHVLATIVCDDSDSEGSPADRTASFNVSPGETVTCTYVNAKRGSITIVKDARPDDTTSFGFSGDLGPFNLVDDGGAAASKTVTGLAPGTYEVVEAALAGWQLQGISCVNAGTGSAVDLATGTASIVLEPGGAVTCTFVNEAEPGEVTVTKTVDGVADTLNWSFGFTLTPTPDGVASPQQATKADPTVTFDNLAINTTYTLAEQVPAGWTGGVISCTGLSDLDPTTAGFQFQVEPGQQLTCAVTNTASSSEVEVTKTVTGVTADVEWSFDFSLTPAPTGETGTKTAAGSGNGTASASWQGLVPGATYTIAETSTSGYVAAAMTCTGVTDTDGDATNASVTFVAPLGTAPGAEVSCTITNDAVPGELTVTKTTVGGDGEFSFTLTPTTGDPLTANVTTVGGTGSHTFTDLVPGTQYVLTETVTDATQAESWILGDLTCTVTHADQTTDTLPASGIVVEPGDQIACGVTNTAKGTIIINKNVEGADNTFTFTGSWLTPPEFSITTTGGTGSTTTSNVVPGSYEVFEVQREGYDGTSLVCTDPDGGSSTAGLRGTIDLDAGETVVCTYTNTQRAQIMIIKDARPNDETGFAFTATGNDMPAGFTLVDDGVGADDNVWTSAPLAAGGTYTVTEQATAGWTLDVEASSCSNNATIGADGSVSIVPTAGETVVCTFVNTADPGKVTVTKTVAGVADTLAWSFDITLAEVGGSTTKQVTGTGGGTDVVEFGDLKINTTYTLTEQVPAGWTAGDLTCTGVTDLDPNTAGLQFQVEAGQVLTCAVTNTASSSEVEVTKTVAGVTADVEWSFDFSLTPAPTGETGTKTAAGSGNGTGAASWQGLVPGATYTIAETPVSGWTAGAMTCTGVTDTDGDATNASVTFVAPLGTSQAVEVTCAVTNDAVPGELTVTKTTIGGDGEFSFTLTPTGGAPLTANVTTVGGTGSHTFTDLVPGTQYVLTEAVTDAAQAESWILGDLTCTVTEGNRTRPVPASRIIVEVGQQIACGVTNTAKGTIIINKNVEGADGTFDFTGSWLTPSEFSITTSGGTGSLTTGNVVPGSYTVSESSTTDYDGTNLVCVDPDGGSSTAGLRGTIDLDAGETVVCTYTNTQRAQIVIIKDARPNDETSFGFTTTGEDMAPTFSLVDNGVAEDATWTSALLRAGGTYTVTEQVASGWTLDTEASSCTNGATISADGTVTVVPTAGETVVCTFVNTADPGKVTVTKTVAGVADTLAWSFDITLSEAGGSTTKQVTGTGEGTDVVEFGDLKINTTYTLVEQSVAGWTAGDLTCTGVTDLDPNTAGLQFQVEAGQQLTCAITNTATTSEVEVTKSVAAVTADVEWSFDFTLTGPGSETDTKTTWGAGETTQVAAWGNLLPGGTYTLAETSVPGWTDGAMTCTGVTDTDGDATNASVTFVAPLGTSQGVEISCTVTNTAVDGTVTVTKTSVGGDGEFTFQLQPLPGGTPLVATAGTTDGTGTATFTGLTTGMQYELTEINVGPEWIAGAITCTVTHADGSTADLAAVDFTVSAGDAIECEAVNTAKGTIVINKHVEGADGEFDFTGTWLDPEEFSITTEQGSGSQTFSNVDPGTYTVNEVGTPSYDGTDLVCSTGGTVDGLTGTIVLEPGATVSCTYTNTERASIVIIKDARPNDETSFGFTTTGEDMAPTFSLVDNGVAEDATWTSALLRVGGTYTVTEQVASGWTLDTEASSCTNGATVSADGTVTVVPTAGETVVCTFVNTADAGSVTVTKTAADVVEGYGWSFDITLADEGGAETTRQVSGVGNATDTVTFGDLEINTRYTLREAPAAGWTGGDVTCVGLTDLDPETPGLQFEVEAGQVLECTLTNTMGKPGIELVKSAELDDTNGDGVGNVGETITFSFLVSNIGMLPLTGVAVDDPLLAAAGVAITCPASDLLVGEEMTCTSSPYTITAADVTAGEVHNVATATGTLPPGDDGTPPPTVTSPPSETHTPTGPLPVLTVVPPPVEPPLVVMPPLAVTGAPAIWQAVAGALLLIMTGAGLLIGRNRRGRN